MGSSGQALVALPAGHGWIDGYAVARADTLNCLSYSLYLTGSFMAHGKRILYHLAADPARHIIMDIRTAHAQGSHPDQHIIIIHDDRIGNLHHLHLANAC